MHSYLRAIGFTDIDNRKNLNVILEKIIEKPSNIKRIAEYKYVEISKEFSENLGITARGEYDENNNFHIEHYFPYLSRKDISIQEEVEVNKRVDTESYTGIAEDFRIGVSLMFYIQNVVDHKEAKSNKVDLDGMLDISLSGLSLEGKILLPVKDHEKVKKIDGKGKPSKSDLIEQAKKGDEEAIEILTINDIDTYAMVANRIRTEDIYSIVDSSFIPFGSESDNYSILGSIIDFKKETNTYTGEEIYIMDILCNDIEFTICINEKDLIGAPMIGRRFKGNIWLQGNVDFQS